MPHLLLTIRLFAAALLSGAALASCDGVALTDELPLPPPTVGALPIGFDATTTDMKPDATSRAGEINTTNIASMGVFASYTGTSSWTASSTPNFMYNQQVTRSGTNPWTYTPIKYWPNTPGERISFFAYAPYGAATVSGNTKAGYPVLTYTVPTTIALQTDLLAATPLMNNTQSTAPLSFTMKHVMTRILVKAKCTEKIEINSVQLNEARGTGNLTLNGNQSWSIGNTPVNFKHSTATTVSNTTKDVAEFFMLPFTGKSITVNLAYNGTTETKTVSLPTTPAWTQGTLVAYTLNIEVGSEITLTATWNTSTIEGEMGKD